MALVVVGRLGRPHGVRGEIVLDSDLTVQELGAIGRFTWRGADGRTAPLVLSAARPVHRHLLATFQGYGVREAVAELTLGDLLADEGLLPDPGPGTAYAFQLVGLEVRTGDGRRLGRIADVMRTGANPIYVVQDGAGAELMIPAVPEFVRRVDLAAREVVVELPPGLEEAT